MTVTAATIQNRQTRAEFECDISAPGTSLEHFWEHTVGSAHAPIALRADWQEQLRRAHDELGFRHVRFHGLLSDRMGTLICHKEELLYSFFNVDRIFDFLLSIGMKPFIELSFMPETLASGHKTVFDYEANVTPPKDYFQWGIFMRELVTHLIERYGREEVRSWYFEVWNEPNLHHFWTGTQDDYFKLYRYTVEAIKGVDASLRVGGPATAANEWITEFVEFCEQNNLAADFISTHHYPTDAFGDPDDDTQTQLAKSRRSVLREQAQRVREQAQARPVYYTEWNTSSNPRDPLHDEPYAAAFVTKTIMEANGLVDGYSFWTFSDIFEENYFPSKPFHGGFGLLNLYGIPKPTYRAFDLLHQLGTETLKVRGDHDTVDAWVIRKQNALTVLLTNHALPRHPIKTELLTVRLLENLNGAPATEYVQRIDENHANPKALWREMGEPEYLSDVQLRQLEASTHLIKEPLALDFDNRTIHIDIDLPPHGVAAITLEFAPAS